jgi:N-methylhydantoinase A/oxoprolinase/acetone carboxylase beta subunit
VALPAGAYAAAGHRRGERSRQSASAPRRRHDWRRRRCPCQTRRRLLRKADLGEIQAAWDTLADQALTQLAVKGFRGAAARLRRSAALHYQGQTYELTVPGPLPWPNGQLISVPRCPRY